MNQAPPELQDYPGWFPAKLPLWRRRWVQVTTASVVAFLFGIGLSGSPSTDNMMSLQRAHTLADQAAADARVEAVADAQEDVLSAPQVVAALDQEREQAKAQVNQAQAKAQRQAKLLASARQQIRTLKQQKAAAVAAKKQAQQAANHAREVAAAAPAPAPAPDPVEPAGTDPRFSYCYEANDAGYGPYFQGEDPEYDWYDDADNDGEVCE